MILVERDPIIYVKNTLNKIGQKYWLDTFAYCFEC